MAPHAWVVVDLGFGDAGKGSITDFLVRDQSAGLVVRFNGGAQAGHNVITPDGRHHTFSQFGSGSFVAGTKTLLGPDFLLHPWGMLIESEHLERAGVTDIWQRTAIDGRCRLITPYQQATNRIREQLRGANAHGTCGIGIGECAADSLDHPHDTLRAQDLHDPKTLRSKLVMQRRRKRAALVTMHGASTLSDFRIFDDNDMIDHIVDVWSSIAAQMWITTPQQSHTLITDTPRVVFEGAQGVLLDEDHGFHPHTTWSHCTAKGAMDLIDDRAVTRLGLTRGVMVRHGAGPLPTHRADLTAALPEPHNENDGWQGQFRVGDLDLVLLRYALAVCGDIDGLVMTHLDRLSTPVQVCTQYADGTTALPVGLPGDLNHNAALCQQLFSAQPTLTPTSDPIATVEAGTGCPVLLTSHGPAAGDKRWRHR